MTAKFNANRDYYRRSYFAMLLLVLTAILSSRVTYSFDADVEGGFEPVDLHRRRMGIENGYKTRVLNAESCRDYSERECEEMEDSFIEQVANLRKLQSTQSKDINVVVLLIRFSDHASRNLPSPSDINLLFNDPGKTGDVTPTGSVKTYLAKNSYDKIRINAIVSEKWVDAAGSELSCAGPEKGVNNHLMDCFAPALDALENSRFNWSDFEQDGDGRLDAVIVLHSGYASSQGKTDEDGVDSSERIQSHARSPPAPTWESPRLGIRLGNYVVVSGYRGVANQQITRLNVISHEFLHILGAIDIYDTSFKTYGAGGYALMAYPYGHTGSREGAATPGHVSPWVKIQLGLLTPIEITQDGTYLARPSLTTRDIYKISAPYPDGEYLLIENRPAIEWDAALGGGGGIVIWSIDDNIVGNTENGQEVVVLQADGKFDLENFNNLGDEGDFWVTGRELKPTGAVSTKSRRTGASNGMRIYNFSPPGSEESFFTIENLAPALLTPAPVQTPTVAPVQVTTSPPVQDTTTTAPITAAPIVPATTAAPVQTPTVAPVPVTTSPPVQDTTTAPITAAPIVPATTAAPVQTPTVAPVPVTTSPPVQDTTTAPITAAPTVPATAAPIQTPTFAPIPTQESGQCFVSVNSHECFPLMVDQEPIENCECYNFCNGEPTCCKFGEFCRITCSGKFVAGCVKEPTPTCPVSVNFSQCSSLLATQTPVEDCECYNFCNRKFIGCSRQGEFITISCKEGLVAGCQLQPDSTPTQTVPTAPPSKAPTRKQSFFFWVV
jgi:M6 family metalloprotease-like protein